MKTARAPKSIETRVAGESLFNDGIGVVLFVTLLGVAMHGRMDGPGQIAFTLLRQVAGGAVVGFLAGAATYQLLKRVDNYQVEVLLTLALVLGGYALAEALHTSAPIAMVVAGLLIGNHGRAFAMSENTRKNLDMFWELIDEILNAVLFLLVGVEVLVMHITHRHLFAMLLIIPAVLLARWCSVAGAMTRLTRPGKSRRAGTAVLTWAGLRGGLSVAMALSLPPGPMRNTIIAITYGVVIFSILIQGTTMPRFVKHYMARGLTEDQG